MKVAFQKKVIQAVLFFLFWILFFICIDKYADKRIEHLLLNGIRTEAEIKQIFWTKRGYKASYWYFDTIVEDCFSDAVLLDSKTEGVIQVGDRYVVYFISGKDNQIFLDSPLIKIEDNRITIDDVFYKQDTLIKSVCWEIKN
ncbi:MAG: hypothetical protein H6579_03020 [Chitinophagales bacterium]|nr:hypothetical protein [Chitinophagales bacterium]